MINERLIKLFHTFLVNSVYYEHGVLYLLALLNNVVLQIGFTLANVKIVQWRSKV